MEKALNCFGAFFLIGQLPTLPRTRARSTIGADGLNDRVRDVTGCTTVAQITKRPISHVKSYH